MIDGLKLYPEYKQAGVPRIGRIPRHWEVSQARQLGRFIKGVGGSKQDTVRDGIPCVRYGELYSKFNNFIRRPNGFISPSKLNHYTPIMFGDILFAASGEKIEEIGKSAVNLLDQTAVCGGDIIILRPDRQNNPIFLGFALECSHATIEKSMMGRGTTIKHVYPSELKFLNIILPPITEQLAISKFLTLLNQQIDQAIHSKRKLLFALNEQRNRIIHNAVTAGVNPGIIPKHSELDWLREYPSHWELLRAKYLFREIDVRSTRGTEELLSVSHITGVTPRRQKNVTMFKAASYAGHKLCQPGDLVVNTMWAWMGAMGISNYDGIISPAYSVYRPLNPSRFNPEFVDKLLRTRLYINEYLRHSTGVQSSRLRLYPDKFLRIPILLPPRDEQNLILQSITSQTDKIDIAINSNEREIALLREYRKRMISDVVTGQFDVRSLAAQLPDLTSENLDESEIAVDEPLDDEVEDAA